MSISLISYLRASFPYLIPIDSQEGSSALMLACFYGQLESVRELIQKGADIQHASNVLSSYYSFIALPLTIPLPSVRQETLHFMPLLSVAVLKSWSFLCKSCMTAVGTPLLRIRLRLTSYRSLTISLSPPCSLPHHRLGRRPWISSMRGTTSTVLNISCEFHYYR
jgi:hypothetical protein